VAEDGGVGAAGVLQGVGEDGEAVEGPLLVDGRGELGDGAAVPREDGGGESGQRR
jgi:hypothetical protein